MASAEERLVNIIPLKKCRLWYGSLEQSDFLYCGGLYESQVRVKIKQLEACNDRTAQEEEYLNGLRAALHETYSTPSPVKGPKP